jgi:transposase
MAKKHDNEFKVMIVELLESGSKAKEIGVEYGLDIGMIRRWKREFFSKVRRFLEEESTFIGSTRIKSLKKGIKRCNDGT